MANELEFPREDCTHLRVLQVGLTVTSSVPKGLSECTSGVLNTLMGTTHTLYRVLHDLSTTILFKIVRFETHTVKQKKLSLKLHRIILVFHDPTENLMR